MTKNLFKKLAIASFTDNKLDIKRVKRISEKLKRKELREYVKFLKIIDAGNKITVYLPDLEKMKKNEILNKFERLFPNKKIELKEQRDLILGLRVVDNDKVFDFNLQNSFLDMNEQIKNL